MLYLQHFTTNPKPAGCYGWAKIFKKNNLSCKFKLKLIITYYL